MTTIITRTSKGAAITNNEFDANLNNLNNYKIEDLESNRPSIRPTLDLDFASTKSLSQKVAFSRGSTGTYYDGKTTVKAEENLFIYSQQFTAWISSWTARTDNSTTAPDSTNTAALITETSDASNPRYRHVSQNVSITSGQTYTLSCYVKNISASYVGLTILGASNQFAACYFNLSTNTPQSTYNIGSGWSVTSTSIVSVGSGWYRCTLTAVSGTTGAGTMYISLSNDGTSYGSYGMSYYTTSTTNSINIWGAQLEQRSQVTAYTATTTTPITNYISVLQTATSGLPRFDCDPVTGESKGLLVESSATNLLTYSSDFENAIWGKVNALIQAKCIVAPDGTLTGTKIVENNVNGIHLLYLPYTWTANTYTYTIYVKPISRYSIGIGPGSTSIWAASATYDLQAVTANASYGSASISVVGNGWYRLSLTGVATAGTTNLNALILQSGALVSYTGDGYSGIYVWGAQLELGSFATSYISTPMTYSGRGSTGTYLGSNGYVQTAPANVARYQPNAAGGSNILLEGASSNLLNWANDFSSARWGAVSTNTPIVQNNIGIAPDGTFTASSITFTGTNTWWGRSYGFVTGNTYTFSLWVKVSDGLGTLTDLSLTFYSTGGGVQQHVTGFTITNSWQLITATFSSVVNGTGTSHAVIRSNSTRQINVWGSQLEQASSGSSLIPSVESFTSRASTGTYYDSSSTALAEQNLYTYSQSFGNAFWLLQSSAVLNSTTATAPDGSSTAADVSLPGLYASFGTNSYSVQNGVQYTLSFWARRDTGTNTLSVYSYTGVSVGTYSPTSSWTRYTFTFTWSNAAANLMLAQDRNVSGFGNVQIWGAQLEQRSFVTAYTPTTSAAITNYIPVMKTAPSNIARYDYDPVTRLSKGLMVEPAATNLLTYSSGFDNAAWAKTECAISSNATIAPDGTLSADKYIPSVNNADHLLVLFSSLTSATYSFSVYAKAGGHGFIRLATTGVLAFFNLTTGTVATISGSPTVTISSVGNGWYRCSITATTASNPSFSIRSTTSDNASTTFVSDGYSGIFIWGAQLETGSVATSYIPTTSAQVTRSADVATSTAQSRAADVYSSTQVTRAADSAYITDTSWLNQNEGTFYFDKKILGTKANQTLFSLDNGTTDIESRTVLVPNSRNLLTYTDQFDNAAWGKTRSSLLPNVVIAPDGSMSGDKFVEDTTTSSTHAISSTLITISSQSITTCSIFVKSAERTWCRIGNGGVSNGGIFVNLSTGAVGTVESGVTGYRIDSVGNGWYRVSISGTAVSTSAQLVIQTSTGNGVVTHTGDGTSGVYLWGAQLELGSTATTYEPNPLYLSTLEVGSDGYALSDNNRWNNLAAYAYNTNDIGVSQTNTTYASVNIQSSTAGTKAIINKTSGTVDLKNCNVRDINAGGGATYTASKTNNSYDYGNNFGITFQ